MSFLQIEMRKKALEQDTVIIFANSDPRKAPEHETVAILHGQKTQIAIFCNFAWSKHAEATIQLQFSEFRHVKTGLEHENVAIFAH